MKRFAGENNRLPTFTKRFRELQGERTNTEFADYLGLSRQTVGFYCNGDRIPDAVVLRHIAEKCKVSVDWLLGLSEVQSTDATIQQICKFTGLNEEVISVLKMIEMIDGELLNNILASEFFLYFMNNLSSYCFAYMADSIANAVQSQVWECEDGKSEKELAESFEKKIRSIIQSNKVDSRLAFSLKAILSIELLPSLSGREEDGFVQLFDTLVDDELFNISSVYEYKVNSCISGFINIADRLAKQRINIDKG